MDRGAQPDRGRVPADRPRHPAEESILRGGLRGIAIVTAATLALGLAALLIAVLVSAFL